MLQTIASIAPMRFYFEFEMLPISSKNIRICLLYIYLYNYTFCLFYQTLIEFHYNTLPLLSFR